MAISICARWVPLPRLARTLYVISQEEFAADMKIILEPGNEMGNFFPKTRKQDPENNKRHAEGPGTGQANG